jgi:hypothetical protein
MFGVSNHLNVLFGNLSTLLNGSVNHFFLFKKFHFPSRAEQPFAKSPYQPSGSIALTSSRRVSME